MAKSTGSKTQTPEKVPKSKKTANSIVRGHPVDNIIHGARKRHPTQRLLDAIALEKATHRTKKPKAAAAGAKKKVKRLGTMQVTAKEGKAFLDKEEKAEKKRAKAAKKAEGGKKKAAGKAKGGKAKAAKKK
mmetsp:Transcript_49787/g.57357  ORF Transcript_49787/g.57357 Transcript_49787/m.57357 type:complete len:131 (+) Transcript_49787:45-437(+)